ncbi:diiron oxygenase [Streptomyces rubiginosohelvolus]|uniref:diiron oxygenase n=1 Tax=Streptomyces rubiginosohelvolus TaxID=67362 RepID=UPI0036B1D91F
MCGTVGLFLGCSAVSFCPKRVLADSGIASDDGTGNLAESTEEDTYRSPFQSWYERSTVRRAPRRVLSDQQAGQYYFAPELVPLARHSLVTELRPELFDQVLVRQLLRYLHFTSVLENVVVNRTVLGIANGSIGIPLPDAMRLDAYKVYCDEAYHALFSVDMAQQVREATGIGSDDTAEPFFLWRLRALLEEAPHDLAPLVEMLFVVVSETLISAQLSEIPSSKQLVPAVRDVVRDHAVDEGRHHAYFAMFLRHLWGSLDAAQRRAAALYVPRLIRLFIDPDEPATHAELLSYGLSRDEAHRVVGELFPEHVVAAHARATARQTVQYFVDLDVLDHAQVHEEFVRTGLL